MSQPSAITIREAQPADTDAIVAMRPSRPPLELARARGADTVTLLTTTAADYFSRFGFRAIDQGSAPGPVRQSTQFNGICPSAVAIQLNLNPSQATS